MKKNLFAVVAATAMSVGLAGIWGCGGDDEDGSAVVDTNTTVIAASTLVGNWSLTTIEQAGVSEPSPYKVDLVVRDDGTLTWSVNGESEAGTYTKTAGTLNMVFPATPAMNQSHQYWITGTNLFLQMAVDNRYMFTRI